MYPFCSRSWNREALEALDKFLDISQSDAESAVAHHLKGVAYQQLGELEQAVESLEASLQADEGGPNAAEAHRRLSEAFAALGNQAQADEHADLYEKLTQG